MNKPKQENTKESVSKIDLGTKHEITWCPGCPNFFTLTIVKNTLSNLIKQGYKQENFAIATGIGCHPKIFDYLNVSGIYGLHGRVIPLCTGMKLGNPNLSVIGFAGDGDCYNEGMEHLIHAARFNSDFTMIVSNNQNFALTTGQPTSTSQQGYISKAEPLGELYKPLNPIKIMLASGASFVARINPKDIPFSCEVLEKAIKHNGFSFVEIIQDCISFNQEINSRDKISYKINDNNDIKKAFIYADEWDYNSNNKGKIAVGVIFKEENRTMEEAWPQLKKLKDNKSYWKVINK